MHKPPRDLQGSLANEVAPSPPSITHDQPIDLQQFKSLGSALHRLLLLLPETESSMDSGGPIREKRLYPKEIYPYDRKATPDGFEAFTGPFAYPYSGAAGDESVCYETGEKLVFLQHESTDHGRPDGKNHYPGHNEWTNDRDGPGTFPEDVPEQ
jgi:hypothetical protein